MSKRTRILMLETEQSDAHLIAQELRAGGLTFGLQRVDNRQFFSYELENHTPDLILSDHEARGITGMAALAMAQEKFPEVPFIFVTSRHGEEAAVEALKNGATDYILKNQLNRLVPAIRCALRETVSAQKRTREFLRRVGEFCPDALFATNPTE